MMEIKKLLAIIAMMAITATKGSQDKKLCTLEDRNYGGNNYANLRPQSMWLTRWSEKLIETGVEECRVIDTQTGKKK